MERRPSCTRCAPSSATGPRSAARCSRCAGCPTSRCSGPAASRSTGTRAEVIDAADHRAARPRAARRRPPLGRPRHARAPARARARGRRSWRPSAPTTTAPPLRSRSRTALGSVLHIEPLPDDAARTLLLDTVPTATEAEVRDLVDGSRVAIPLLLTCAPVLPGVAAADDRLDRARGARVEPTPLRARRPRVARPPVVATATTRSWPGSASSCTPRSEGWALRHDSFGQAALSLCSPRRADRDPPEARGDERHRRRTGAALPPQR